MLINKRLIEKISRCRDDYGKVIFKSIASIKMDFMETADHLRTPPGEDAAWQPAAEGMEFGRAWTSYWFRGTAQAPNEADGQELYLEFLTTAPECLLFVDGKPSGIFDAQNGPMVHFYMGGNHHHARLSEKAEQGDSYKIAIEAYAGHPTVGSMPNDFTPEEVADPKRYIKTFKHARLALKRHDVAGFVFDLWTLLSMTEYLPKDGLRYGQIAACLRNVFEIIDQHPQELPEEVWRPKLELARDAMRPALAAKNGSVAPRMGVIGHSHMDTAWHWTVAETIRKCARTYSNALALMDQYPDFKFIQSSVVHADMMREHYPDIFEGMKQRIAEGRWEPNGAMWVEPDCNISGGEAFVRQFLIGQRKTREWFGYTADTFWLPDTFGYSAAMPQLMLGCGVKYFCTTKLSWNDTNRFPHDCFVWHGLDGSEVIAHFIMVHLWPLPETLNQFWQEVQHKDVQDRRMLAYGFGDGGGGPQFEQIEIARRVEDLQDCPRTTTTTASSFMKDLEKDIGEKLPHWHGELYLEMHRGTLTSIAPTKKLNRQVELALRDAEMMWATAAVQGAEYPHAEFQKQWKVLLLNQFHDILPGSSIPEVNDQAREELTACLNDVRSMTRRAGEMISEAEAGRKSVSIFNTLSWDRHSEFAIPADGDLRPAGDEVLSQRVQTVDGRDLLVMEGIKLPALGSAVIDLVENKNAKDTKSFDYDGNTLNTSYSTVSFDNAGRISSFIHKAEQRELVEPGKALNTLLIGQDIPHSWDNWDIDEDQELKMEEEKRLESREVVAEGPLQFRIRSVYKIGYHSTMTQDMVFHASTARIDFETVVDWNEKHMLLKAAFPTAIHTDVARHEIQFGHVQRPTHRNRPTDRAMFETCNHKWTDLSESQFGVALLNDCKYGIGIYEGTMALSLIKSGTHPDARGDQGRHVFRYSFLPHEGSLNIENVIHPAYEFNVEPISVYGSNKAYESLLRVGAGNVIVEAVKIAEDSRSLIVRLYEAEGAHCHTAVEARLPVRRASLVNLLEEEPEEVPIESGKVNLTFSAFEIKTLKLDLN